MGVIPMQRIVICLSLRSSFTLLSFAQAVVQENAPSVMQSTTSATTGFDKLQFLRSSWLM